MPSHRSLLPLAFASLFAACTIPIDTGLGGAKGAASPATAAWESSTKAAADAVEQGRVDEAEKHLEDARRAAVSQPGGDEYAASLMNLGHVHAAKGDTGNAIVFYERALVLREQHLGKDHLEVANTLNTLGASYAFEQRYDDAQRAFTRALAIREKTLGENNLLVGQSLNNLALLYAGKGEFDEAEPLYKRAIEVIQHAPDSSRADLIRALDNYTALLDDTGRKDEADAMRARAAAERKEYDRFHDELNPLPK
jgi:tetratricopeptide (TPR) repeat protein